MKKIAIVLVLAVLSFAAYVQAQPGGGGRRGGGGPSLTIERDWALITFGLKVRGDNLRALQYAYQDAWDQRKALMEAAATSGDRSQLGLEMGKIQGVVDASVKNILTQEQYALFEVMRKESRGGGGGGGRRGR